MPRRYVRALSLVLAAYACLLAAPALAAPITIDMVTVWPPASVEAEVENAMAIMERIETVCGNPAAREELNRLVQDLGIRIGLTFREGRRNNRSVRVLQGDIVAFGNRPLPCTLRNRSGRPLAGGLTE